MEFVNRRLSLFTACGSEFTMIVVAVTVIACGRLICNKQHERVRIHLKLSFIY